MEIEVRPVFDSGTVSLHLKHSFGASEPSVLDGACRALQGRDSEEL